MSIQVKDLYERIDAAAPFGTQCSWDNSGLNVGSMNAPVSGVLFCLDCTVAAVEKCVSEGFDTIVSHHPLLFRATKTVFSDTAVYAAVRAGLNVICAHTCLDMAPGGVNDVLAGLLELEDIEPLYAEGVPMMRMGRSDGKDIPAFARFAAEKLGSGDVSAVDCGNRAHRVAVGGGSCAEYLDLVRAAGCDVFVTGEAKHSFLIRAREIGLSLVVGGHYETENPVMRPFAENVMKAFPTLPYAVFDEPPAAFLREVD